MSAFVYQVKLQRCIVERRDPFGANDERAEGTEGKSCRFPPINGLIGGLTRHEVTAQEGGTYKLFPHRQMTTCEAFGVSHTILAGTVKVGHIHGYLCVNTKCPS